MKDKGADGIPSDSKNREGHKRGQGVAGMLARWLRSGLQSGRVTESAWQDAGERNPEGKPGSAVEGRAAGLGESAARETGGADVFRMTDAPGVGTADWDDMDDRVARRLRRVFGRSLHVLHIDVGSCNACESEVLALSNPQYNFHRFGVFFTPSPRHADVLLVTGALTPAMAQVLRSTYEAMPRPRLVIAAGVCTLSGGVFRESRQFAGPVESVVPVDVYITGCPPAPRALLQGILQAVGRKREGGRS